MPGGGILGCIPGCCGCAPGGYIRVCIPGGIPGGMRCIPGGGMRCCIPGWCMPIVDSRIPGCCIPIGTAPGGK
eukprot:scaffold18862_cov63-Phaeocystis_antarctica.AAC.1